MKAEEDVLQERIREFSSLLFELFEYSLNNNFSSSLDGSVTPMELCTHIVTTMASLLRNENDFMTESTFTSEQFSSKILFLNNQSMVHIPHDSAIWSGEVLGHVRRLIFRTIVVFCYVVIKGKNLLRIFLKNEETTNFIEIVRRIIKENESDRKESVPKLKITKDEEDAKDVQSGLIASMELLRDAFHICEILLDVGHVNTKQLMIVIGILHEFNYCGGLVVMQMMLLSNEELSPSCSDESASSNLQPIKSLLSSFKNVLFSVKTAKSDYAHNLSCVKRSHKNCKIDNELCLHHDVLGEAENCSIIKSDESYYEHENMCVISVTHQFLTGILKQTVQFSNDLTSMILLTVDRIGICSCMPPSVIVLPILKLIPDLCEVKTALVVLARLLLQLNTSDDVNLLNEVNLIFDSEVDAQLNIFKTPVERNRFQIEEELAISSASSIFRSNKMQWLCFVIYKHLLLLADHKCTKCDLTILKNEVMFHLEVLSPSLQLPATFAIFFLVVMPIISIGTHTSMTCFRKKSDDESASSHLRTNGTFCDDELGKDILERCLRLSTQLLRNNEICRKAFVRHNGIKALVKLVTHEQILQLRISENVLTLQEAALQTLTVLLTNPTMLSQEVSTSVLKFVPKSLENSPKNVQESKASLRTLFQSRFKQSSPKRDKSVVAFSENDRELKWMSCEFNEVKSFTNGVRKIVKTIKTFTQKACRLQMTVVGNAHPSLNADSQDEFFAEEFYGSSSDTTGYESRSRTSSFIDDENDDFALPFHDFDTMYEICTIWQFYARTLQFNKELLDFFGDYGGPDLSLKLLHHTVLSLVPPRQMTGSDFTNSLNTTQHDLGDTASVNTLSRAVSRSPSISSIKETATLTETSSINRLSRASSIVMATDDFYNNERMETKLEFLSTMLNVSLLCTVVNENDEAAMLVEEVISTVKPLLQQSKLTESAYCRDLCQGLFRAAVEEKVAQEHVQKPSLVSVMSVLRRQINNAHSQKSIDNWFERLQTPVKTSKNLKKRSSSMLSDIDDDWSFYNDMSSDEYTASDGYHGDSESDSSEVKESTTLDEKNSVSGDLGVSNQKIFQRQSESLVPPCGIIHPDVLMLIVEVLAERDQIFHLFFNDSSKVKDLSQHNLNRMKDFCGDVKAVVKTLQCLADYSSENIDLLTRHCDITASCFVAFSFGFQNETKQFKSLQDDIFHLCLTLNKHSLSSHHLTTIFSFLNGKNPPVGKIVKYLSELVSNEQIGPSSFLSFPDISLSDNQSTPCKSPVFTSNKLSSWKIAASKFNLGSYISWPSYDPGVTIVTWLKMNKMSNVKSSKRKSRKRADFPSAWSSPQVVLVDLQCHGQTDNRTCVHLFSVGSKQLMLQVWLNNDVLVFRICVDPNDNKTVGILAETHCADFLASGEWLHLAITYSESKMPDKAILGKVHLIVNSLIERDVLLEYNCPHKTMKKMDTYLMIGHTDVIDRPSSSNTITSYNLGNVSIFDRVHFTRTHADILDFCGADRTTLSSCIISEANTSVSEAATKSKIKYTGGTVKPSHADVDANETTGNLNVDAKKNLTKSLAAVFQSNQPSICLVKSQTTATSNERKSIFARGFLSYQTNASNTTEEDVFTQEFSKINSFDATCSIPVIHHRGLHQVLRHLGGIRVFVMLFAKVVEVTHVSSMSNIEKEQLQCDALQTIINLRAHDPTRKQEFVESNCAKLLYKVLSKQQCQLGYNMMRVLFNACCQNEGVIEAVDHEEQPPDFNVNFDSNAVIHDQEIFQHFISDPKLWRKSYSGSCEESSYPVWQSLMHGIRSLIREDHPYQWKNINAIVNGRFIEKILMDLQQTVADGGHGFPDKNVTMLIVDVINTIASNIPATLILKNIADFLLAIHPPAGTFVCHSPSSFYFNLLSETKTSNTKHLKKKILSQSNPASPTDHSFTNHEKFGLVRTSSVPASSPWKQATRRASMLSGSVHSDSSDAQVVCNAISDESLSTIDEERVKRKNINGDVLSNTSDGIKKPTSLLPSSGKMYWENLPHVSNPIELVTSPMKSPIEILPEDLTTNRAEELESQTQLGHSVTYLTLELLRMLYLFIMDMNDSDAAEFLGTNITSTNLIVMTHHDSAEVRAATIRLLSAFFARCNPSEHENFLQMKGFHLVANQLHQHSSDREIIESCFFILLGHQVVTSDPLSFDLDITDPLQNHRSDPFKNHAAIFLLSLLENASEDVYLCVDLTKRLIELFENLGPIADVMLDNGLTIALCNLIIRTMSSKKTMEEKEAIVIEVEYFMSLIAIKSCVTSGSAHFNVFEDLMTLLYIVENHFVEQDNISSYSVMRVQAITHRIILQAFDSMPKTTSGKSPVVYRRNDSSSSIVSIDSKSIHHATVLNDIVFDSNVDNSQRRASSTSDQRSPPLSMISSTSGISRSNPHKRSLSSSTDGSSSISSGWRSRSYKGKQRRKVNENETSRRLQRIVTIAVERISFKKQNHGSGRDATLKVAELFTTQALNNRDIIQTINEANRNFDGKVFNLLMNWLSSLISSNQHLKRSSMRSRLTSLTSMTITPAWERILLISKSSLIEQASNLFVHLLSPWQSDFTTRLLPLSLTQTMHCEKLLSWIIPVKSEHAHKVSVYTYYLLCYYKQNLTPQNKKDLKQFCKTLHKLGHKILPVPLTRKMGFDHPDGDINMKDEEQDKIMEDVEIDQEAFDHERQMFEQVCRKQNLASFSSLSARTNRLAEIVSNHAMDVTREVVLKQNIERKKMIASMKTQISDDLLSRQQWSCLIEQLTHERAVWHDSAKYPTSWQLDNTEGPNRERKRLQRCHLQIPNRFMLGSNAKDGKLKQPNTSQYPDNAAPAKPLAFIFEDDSHTSDSVTIRTRLQTNERIMMVQSCMIVTPSCETSGEILIGEQNVYFVGDELLNDPMMVQATFSEKEVLTLSWRHQDFTEICKRWWQLRDVAMEIFLSNGKTYLIAFKDVGDRNLILDELKRLDLPNLLQQNDLLKITQLWRNGKMTNFEYLTQLNKFAGRSFNDLMQYPIMPFILADYKSTILNLNDPKIYRNLLKPISVQDTEREAHYSERYNFLRDEYNNCQPSERELRTAPFHYGSHYSNSGTVLHFLVRLPPFTRMFLEYQDDSFDIPDRTFHSLETTYKLSSFASTTDVKELIPEFFFMPEFLCNLEGFDFGLRQCGLRVHHVNLPPWCKTDPRLFVLIHRQALESDIVRSHINGWIDLVFGFKQTGKAAIDAVNVFHPATYFGMDITSVQDPVKRKALETMVKTYGQTPKLLFESPHVPSVASMQPSDGNVESVPSVDSNSPQLKSSASNKTLKTTPHRPLSCVEGLKWGNYIGSPACSPPVVFLLKPLSTSIGRLVALETNDVCALSPKMSLLVIYNRDENDDQTKSIHWSALVTYGHADNMVRIKLRQNVPGINLLPADVNDKTSCCVSDPDCRLMVFGKKSGKISAYRCLPCPDKSCDLEILSCVSLLGHASEVTNIVVCSTFRILVSASKDGTAIIWDLDNLCYVRSLTGHATAVSAIAVSRTSGDICTVCESGNKNGSHIRLWTINGSLVAAQDSKQYVHCVAFSAAPEGVSVNVVAGGLHNGVIRLWSSWDLSPVRDVETHSISNPIVSLTFTHNNMTLYAATSDGVVIAWCCRDRLKDRQPLLITFVNIKK